MFLTIGSTPEDDINNPDMWFSPYMPRNKVNAMNMFSDPHEWSQILSIHSPHCGKYLHQYETVLHHQRDHQCVTLGRVYTSRELQRCDWNNLVDLPWRLVHKSNKLLNFSFNTYRFMTRLGSLTVFMMRYCSSTCDYTTKNNLSLALVISTSCISYDHLRFCNYWIYLSRRQLLTLHMLLILFEYEHLIIIFHLNRTILNLFELLNSRCPRPLWGQSQIIWLRLIKTYMHKIKILFTQGTGFLMYIPLILYRLDPSENSIYVIMVIKKAQNRCICT